jgi:uncharacterized protein (TIGR02996 family)
MDPLLRREIDSPDDLDARVVYADALEEAGDARGELIHVQVKLAQTELSEDERASLGEREKKLLKKHRTKWLAPFKPYVLKCALTRGFVESIVTDGVRFLAGAAFLTDATPLVHATITGLTPQLVERLVEKAELARLRSLDLGLNRLGPEDAARLAACPHLRGLRVLGLADNALGPAGASALAGAPWPKLASLALDGNALGDAGAAALAAGSWPKLRTLTLARNEIGPAGARALKAGKLRLRSLDLRLNPALGEDAREYHARSREKA